MEQEIQLNEHNKQEYPPMHTNKTNTSLINALYYNTLHQTLKIYNYLFIFYALFYATKFAQQQ